MSFLLFYITVPDKISGINLGKGSVQKRLAACYNLFPISSQFWWQERVEESEEWVLLLKTAHHRKEDLSSFILQHHPYRVPCIMYWTVEANASYSDWISKETLAAF